MKNGNMRPEIRLLLLFVMLVFAVKADTATKLVEKCRDVCTRSPQDVVLVHWDAENAVGRDFSSCNKLCDNLLAHLHGLQASIKGKQIMFVQLGNMTWML